MIFPLDRLQEAFQIIQLNFLSCPRFISRAEGICQVRRELYAQCFEELIRQTLISSLERGLLLLRLRDEFR